MRQTQVLSLLQTGYTTVAVSFNCDAEVLNLRNNKLYTFKTNILDFKEGDLAVIPSNGGGFIVVRIIDAHKEPQIDLDADYDYKWVVCKVDIDDYNAILATEEDALKQLRVLERNKQQKEAKENFQEVYGTDELPMLDYSKGKTL